MKSESSRWARDRAAGPGKTLPVTTYRQPAADDRRPLNAFPDPTMITGYDASLTSRIL
jgi:hypothetical protein